MDLLKTGGRDAVTGRRLRPSLGLPPRAPIGRLSESDERSAAGFGKKVVRALDLTIAILAFVILSPLILLVAIAIKLDGPGPVVYRQLRIGIDRRQLGRGRSDAATRVVNLGGRPFMIHKFRTMHVDAEHSTGPVWASPDDHRATRVGKFLRDYRLDEIPQFWDVLHGNMSVVGPRPERPKFVGKLRGEIAEYSMRQRVRPGITGWAQVNQGCDQNVDDVRMKLQYDLEYVRRKSLWFDLRIMLRTVLVMLVRQGSRPLTPGPEKPEKDLKTDYAVRRNDADLPSAATP